MWLCFNFVHQVKDFELHPFMEVHIQEGSNSSTDQPENFNVVGWASFPEINEKELVRRVSH